MKGHIVYIGVNYNTVRALWLVQPRQHKRDRAQQSNHNQSSSSELTTSESAKTHVNGSGSGFVSNVLGEGLEVEGGKMGGGGGGA